MEVSKPFIPSARGKGENLLQMLEGYKKEAEEYVASHKSKEQMNWQSDIIKNLAWSDTIINIEGKQKVADEIAEKVKDGDILGVGSGSTVYVALLAIAKR